MAFISRHLVRFADIDRAGIVYYPRFFDFFHRAFEDFFAAEVGVPYHKVLDDQRVGFPIVHIESDFRIPLQHGDEIRVEMATRRVGRGSVTMRYRVFRPGVDIATGEPAAEAAITNACVDMGTFQSIPIPEPIRAAFLQHRLPA